MDKSSEMPPPYSDARLQQQHPMLGQQQYPGNTGSGQPLQGQAYPPPPPGYGYPMSQGQVYPTPPQGQGYPLSQPQGQFYLPPGHPQYHQSAPGYQQHYNHNVVIQQPTAGYVVTNGQVERDQMCNAILVTLFCFWPTGVIAIIKASEARSAMARGDTLTSQHQSQSARSMVKVSAIIGIICYCAMVVLIGIYIGVIVGSGVSSYHDDDGYDR